jgi:hypothetical protein
MPVPRTPEGFEQRHRRWMAIYEFLFQSHDVLVGKMPVFLK